MAHLRISNEAEEDIDKITAHTTATWGWRQTDRYLAKLEDGFILLAKNPSIGRTADVLQVGLRRFEIGEHLVFYVAETGGVLIVRVLHERMMPGKYL